MGYTLQVRRGGGAASATEVMDMVTTRKGAAVFEGDTPLIRMGRKFADGEASQGTFRLSDPEAEVHSTTYRLSPHALVTWHTDASGDDLWLARSRIAPLESGRRAVSIGGDEVEWEVQLNDNNMDLRGQAFTEAWVRPAETDVERIIALQAYTLNGSSSTAPHSRTSSNITVDLDTNGHLVRSGTDRNMPARTYPAGTQPQDVIGECAERSGKTYGVVIHHDGGSSHDCLLYCSPLDHVTYVTDVKVSDHIADLDLESTTAPVFPPVWDMGKGTLTENDDVVSGVVVIYGGTNDDPKSVFVHDDADEDPYEYWVDAINDDKVDTDAEAANLADQYFASHRAPGHRTHRFSIRMLASQHHLITAGMSIEVKSAVLAGGPDLNTYVWRRITELIWEPDPDPRYIWARINLEKALRRRGMGAQPIATSPTPVDGGGIIPTQPPVCDPPDPAGLPDDAISADWRSGDPTRVDPVLGGAATYPWGHLGQITDQPYYPPEHTRVDGNEVSQYFSVSPSSQVTVSFAAAKVGGPTTGTVKIVFFDGAGVGLGVSRTQTYPSGEAHSIPGSHKVVWSVQSMTFDTPASAGYAYFSTNQHSLIQYLFAGEPAAPPEDCPPYSVDSNGNPNDPADNAGDSPYSLPSNSPLLTATDQHIITRLSREMTNSSGGDLTAGTVVIATGQDEFTTTSTASYTDGMVGVLKTDTADGGIGTVIWSGVGTAEIPLTSDTAAAGDFIYTSSTPGEVTFDATRSAGAIGVVVEVDGSGNPIFVEWWGVPDSSGGGGGGTTIIVQEDDADVDTAAATLDFRHGLDVTSSPAGEANISVDESELDHGTLAGLGDDDHTIYTKKGTLTNTGDVYYASGASTPARLGIGSTAQVLTVRSGIPAWEDKYASISVVIDGGGSAITTGVKGDVSIPFDCQIVRARLLADQTGSIVIDAWNDTYANYPPTVADTITASAKPTLSSAVKSSDVTLTGWTTTLAEGSTLRINVDSATTVTRVTLELRVKRT